MWVAIAGALLYGAAKVIDKTLVVAGTDPAAQAAHHQQALGRGDPSGPLVLEQAGIINSKIIGCDRVVGEAAPVRYNGF